MSKGRQLASFDENTIGTAGVCPAVRSCRDKSVHWAGLAAVALAPGDKCVIEVGAARGIYVAAEAEPGDGLSWGALGEPIGGAVTDIAGNWCYRLEQM